MFRSALSVAIVISSLLGLATRARGVSCLACQDCIYDPRPDNGGNACLNYWTCSGDTFTCYYPSVQYPGTFTACPVPMSGEDSPLKSADAVPGTTCAGTGLYADDECSPPNNPWNLDTSSCTAAEGYVGAPNSGLL